MTFSPHANHQQAQMPRIGDKAPNFTAETTHGEIEFETWQEGKWVILFSHPADFTPVCTTELAGFASLEEKFTERNCKMIGLSIDSIHSHLAWLQNISQTRGVQIPFPLIADSDRHVSEQYGMIHPGESKTLTVRALFFIDPQQTIRAVIYYPLNVGRYTSEVLRVLDALQASDANNMACPANWNAGEDGIRPAPRTVSDVDFDSSDFYIRKKPVSA